ncbi:uncharacterized protein LOC129923351 [Biomphalaria glabrata]|uniref:Uncharacterized protein LOC129923351 n=1 Tax=Biomphalaria glabrata TaxID=6526 RepID=A0A9W2Z4D8_BIOGL|nr:uncharacterized protein LOC129923351 [Biomphalaria glabrata]
MSKVVDKECLERNYTFVTNEIDALELVDRLVESEAISSSDRTRIVDIKSNIVRNSDLVNIILNSSSEYVLNSFLKSLEPKYKHVLDKLQEQDLTKAIKSSGMVESPSIRLMTTVDFLGTSLPRLREVLRAISPKSPEVLRAISPKSPEEQDAIPPKLPEVQRAIPPKPPGKRFTYQPYIFNMVLTVLVL